MEWNPIGVVSRRSSDEYSISGCLHVGKTKTDRCGFHLSEVVGSIQFGITNTVFMMHYSINVHVPAAILVPFSNPILKFTKCKKREKKRKNKRIVQRYYFQFEKQEEL